jgi:TIR domain-containing protein
MPYMVFISHSNKGHATAEAICNHLESAGIKCWIAPRDIAAGSDWAKGIMRGIGDCRVLVLVFTGHANDSEHVGREVAKASSLGLAVIPFRTEAVNPRENLEYFLETVPTPRPCSLSYQSSLKFRDTGKDSHNHLASVSCRISPGFRE